MMMSSSSSSSSSYTFTPSQWQELEQQALIYKYMASGIPIPSDLLLPIRRSFFLNSTIPNLPPPPHFPQLQPQSQPQPQPTIGWGGGGGGFPNQRGYGYGFGYGYGRKAEDPEPGRCRRTDGKKWRCSKEAFTDSKYCERHMHRGKNRSRKPVEISSSSSSSNTATSTPSSLNHHHHHHHPPLLPLSISAPHHSSYYPYHCPPQYPHTINDQNSHRDHNRFCQGVKDVDEYTNLFSEETTGGGGRGSSWELRPLGLGEPKQSTDYSKEEEEEKEKHCFVLGADFKLGKSDKEREEEESDQKPLRRFFDEWPQKGREYSWMGLEGESSKTQLSISIPMGLHDFPH